MKKRLGLKVLAISIILTIVASGIVFGASPKSSEKVQDETIIFDTGKGTYPSIWGEHQGNFVPKGDMKIEKIYTYPCAGTGGHSEFIEFLYQNGTSLGNGSWEGYRGDWHNITFDEAIKLLGNETYNYIIKTGSYPQIIHKQNLSNSDGIITCSEFTDANNKKYNNRIPAIKFFGEEILPNKPPVAIFNYTPQSPKVNKTILFNASESFDPDGEIKQYFWDFNNDNIIDAYGKTPNHSYSSAGIREAILKIIDNQGAENQTSKEINVSEIPNQPPLALFNYLPLNPKVNRTVVFNASDSFDSDGEIVEYYWLFGDGKNGTGNVIEHNYSAADIYNAILRVTDNRSTTNQTSREINISPNQIPIVNIGGPYSGEVGKSVSFEAYAIDPDGNITEYVLDFGDGRNVSKIITPPKQQVNITDLHNYTAADLYNAILRVTDDNYEPGTHQTIVNITEPIINKTWDEMNFDERHDLDWRFLVVDPTDYVAINHCVYIAEALNKNASNAKVLYGLEDFPFDIVQRPPAHLFNAAQLGGNKSNIEHWGWTNGEDHININLTKYPKPFEDDETRYIWGDITEIGPKKRRLSDYKTGFYIYWPPNQPPIITEIPECPYPEGYKDINIA